MKLLIVLATLFVAGVASAQTSVYHPFPDSAAFWNIHALGCCTSNCPGLPVANPVVHDFVYTYFLSGDTLVNGTNYNKLYRSGSIHTYCVLGGPIDSWNFINNEYVGGFRQDVALKKVYFDFGSAGSESLLYDFNLTVGDTMFGSGQWVNDCAVISSVDSILINGSYRKQLILSTMPPYSVIEGIGSTSGLFEPLCPFEYFGDLLCFSQNGQTFYSAGTAACNNFTYVKENSLMKQFHFSPNPFNYALTITLNEPVKSGSYILYNSLGAVARQGIFQDQTFTIFKETLKPGIYILKLENDNYIYSHDKVIVE